MNCRWTFVIISMLGRPLILTEDECVADLRRESTPPKEAERGGSNGVQWVEGLLPKSMSETSSAG